jgi:hypothetical protein
MTKHLWQEVDALLHRQRAAAGKTGEPTTEEVLAAYREVYAVRGWPAAEALVRDFRTKPEEHSTK